MAGVIARGEGGGGAASDAEPTSAHDGTGARGLRRRPSAEDASMRHQMLGTRTSTNTHLLILVGLIMLAFDGLNPVKRVAALVLRSTAGASDLGWLLVGCLAWAVLQDVHNVVYYAGRIFMNSLLSIFMSRVDVVGLKNLPSRGPLILAANHSNQFVDGMCIVCSVPSRKVRRPPCVHAMASCHRPPSHLPRACMRASLPPPACTPVAQVGILTAKKSPWPLHDLSMASP